MDLCEFEEVGLRYTKKPCLEKPNQTKPNKRKKNHTSPQRSFSNAKAAILYTPIRMVNIQSTVSNAGEDRNGMLG